MNLKNRSAVIKYLTKHVPNLRLDQIYVSYKIKEYTRDFEIVLYANGQMKILSFYDNSTALDLHVPKLIEFFETGTLDHAVYYEPYGTGNFPRTAMRFQNEHAFDQSMDGFRKQYAGADIGFRQVPKPKHFVEYPLQ